MSSRLPCVSGGRGLTKMFIVTHAEAFAGLGAGDAQVFPNFQAQLS